MKWTNQEQRIAQEFAPVVTNYRAEFICDAINAEFRAAHTHTHEDDGTHPGALTSAICLVAGLIGTIIGGFAVISAVIGLAKYMGGL
jgi:hypothetical protein